MAEGIMRKKIRERDLDWEVDSAGTSSWHTGEAPDKRAQLVVKKHGTDISMQRSRMFDFGDSVEFDKILVMDESNFSSVLETIGLDNEGDNVEYIMDYLYPGEKMPVPDPYFGNDGFEEVYQMLDQACDAFIEHQLLKKEVE